MVRVTETRATDQDLTEMVRVTGTRATGQDLTEMARATETRAEEALEEMAETVSAIVSTCHLARMTRMTARLRREHLLEETARTSTPRRCQARI